jgi:hypothetical protein
VSAFLTGEPIPGIELEYELVQALLPGVTVDELNALARQWMSDRSKVVIVTAPETERAALPANDALLAVFDRVAAKQIEPYVDNVAEAPLIESPPVPGRIVASRAVRGRRCHAARAVERHPGISEADDVQGRRDHHERVQPGRPVAHLR